MTRRTHTQHSVNVSPAPSGLSALLRSLLFAAALLLAAAPARAQQDPEFLQYWKLEPQWNPAAAGRTPQLSINGAVQNHALGFEDAGMTIYAGCDIALQLGKTRHGVGALFCNDTFGLFGQKRIALQYAYHVRLWGGVLSIGAEPTIISRDIKGSKADLADANDPAFPSSDITGNGFDLGAGLCYARRDLTVSLSALHLMGPTVTMGETNEYNVKRLYNLGASYNIRLRNPLYTIVPSALFRTDFADYRVDVTARVQYEYEKRRMYAGVNYAPMRSVAVFVGGTLHGIDLCYSFEGNTQGLGIGAGQHEVTLGYKLDLDLGKKGRNVHRSVRWL